MCVGEPIMAGVDTVQRWWNTRRAKSQIFPSRRGMIAKMTGQKGELCVQCYNDRDNAKSRMDGAIPPSKANTIHI